MLNELLEQLDRDLLSAVQAYQPTALNDDEVDEALRSIKTTEGALASLKVKLAAARAARHCHGDGGADT